MDGRRVETGAGRDLPTEVPPDRAALLERYRALVDGDLPEAARRDGWVLRLNHCFGRVLLDDAVGGCWYDHLDRRAGAAYRQLDDDQLEGAGAPRGGGGAPGGPPPRGGAPPGGGRAARRRPAAGGGRPRRAAAHRGRPPAPRARRPVARLAGQATEALSVRSGAVQQRAAFPHAEKADAPTLTTWPASAIPNSPATAHAEA